MGRVYRRAWAAASRRRLACSRRRLRPSRRCRRPYRRRLRCSRRRRYGGAVPDALGAAGRDDGILRASIRDLVQGAGRPPTGRSGPMRTLVIRSLVSLALGVMALSGAAHAQGIATVLLPEDLATMNPYTTTALITMQVVPAVLEPLVGVDPD